MHTFRSRLGGLLAALALGLTTLSVAAAPADAATTVNCSSRVTLEAGGAVVEYGESMYLTASVKHTCPGEAETNTYYGNVVLQRALPGQGWTNVAVEEAGGYVSFDTASTATATASYQAVYQGGSGYDESYAAVTSNTIQVSVIRKVTLKDKSRGGHIVGRFKITPATGLVGKKLTFQVKTGKKWKKYKKVKVRRGGVLKSTFRGSRKGVQYRLIVPAASGLSGYVYGPYRARAY